MSNSKRSSTSTKPLHDDAPATSLRRDQLAIGLVAAMLEAVEVQVDLVDLVEDLLIKDQDWDMD